MEFIKRNKALVTAVVVIIIILGFSLRKPANGPANSGNKQTQKSGEMSKDESANGEGKKTESEKALGALPWTGILKASQEPDKGNLVLISGSHEIYIRTSRDFSKLIDKTVVVSGSGDINRFQLGDIVPAAQ